MWVDPDTDTPLPGEDRDAFKFMNCDGQVLYEYNVVFIYLG